MSELLAHYFVTRLWQDAQKKYDAKYQDSVFHLTFFLALISLVRKAMSIKERQQFNRSWKHSIRPSTRSDRLFCKPDSNELFLTHILIDLPCQNLVNKTFAVKEERAPDQQDL